MSSFVNPVFYGAVPGANMNPTGSSTPNFPMNTTMVNPLLPPTTLSGSTSAASNPYGIVPGAMPAYGSPYGAPATPSGGGTPTMTPAPPYASGRTGSGATGVSNLGAALGAPTTPMGENKLLQSLNKAYGAGIGTSLYNFLAGGAGFSQQAINNLVAFLQPQFEKSQENLLEQFSTGGNRFSSGAGIGYADLLGQQALDVGQLETQMYEQSINDFLSVLTGAGQTRSQQKLAGQQNLFSMLDTMISGGATAGAAQITHG